MDAAHLIEAFSRGAPIHAVNFHNTPAARAPDYDRELRALAERFEAATEDSLAAFLDTGRWPGRKPGVVIALYNGYRDNFDVFRPLLDRHGLKGWFFAASGYVSCPTSEQSAYAIPRNLRTVDGEYPDGRYAMSWDELRQLDAEGHVVASHTRHHTRVSLDDPEAVEGEIVGAQEDFARELGHPVRSFAWLFGGAYGENPVADAAVRRAGYDFLFSNFRIQRLPR